MLTASGYCFWLLGVCAPTPVYLASAQDPGLPGDVCFESEGNLILNLWGDRIPHLLRLPDSGHLASSCVPYFFNELRGAQSSSLPPYCFPSNCPELATTGSSEPWGSLICCSPPRCRRNCNIPPAVGFAHFWAMSMDSFALRKMAAHTCSVCVCAHTRVHGHLCAGSERTPCLQKVRE